MSRFRFPVALAGISVFALAQNQPPAQSPGNNTRPPVTAPAPDPSRPSGRGSPDIFNRQPQMDRQMPVFLSGKVVVDGGMPPPEPVTIERVCNGSTPRPEGYTNSKGHFSIRLGENLSMMGDASVGNVNDTSDITGMSRGSGMGMPGLPNQRGFSERELMGCEIRAALPGYRSQPVSLAGRRFLDNPDLGTIVMKKLGTVEGLTTSMTTLQAPKDAKKSYEKAVNALKKNKNDEARKELLKAVELYPKYAIAWHELGGVSERAENFGEARAHYAKALEADSRFVKPYLQLAGISAREQKWSEVDEMTDRVLKMNPYDFPAAYFYNSVANLNLQNLDDAEKSARDGLKQDEFHRIPKLEHLLGVILAQKKDLSGAVEHMKAYLKFAPNASDVESVRQQIAQAEKERAAVPAPPKN